MDNIIEVRQLSKYYGKHRGIEKMDMTVGAGDFYGFVGPNGAGKSTTIRTLLGFIRPTGGTGTVFGLNCRKNTPEILNRIGYMPSEAFFYGEMRVGEVIRLAARLRRTDCEARARQLCSVFEVDLKKRIDELSLGNRKKVSIVCALQHRPELLVLDEPTSGLDPLMQKAFFDTLKECHQSGTTILLSSHNLTEIQSHCNRLGVVRDGYMIAQGPIREFSQKSARKVRLRLHPESAAKMLRPEWAAGCGLEGFANLHGETMLTGTEALPERPGCADLANSTNGYPEIATDSVGAALSFLYRGDMNRLMHSLAEMDIYDILIEEPGLEEIIMHYYENDIAREQPSSPAMS